MVGVDQLQYNRLICNALPYTNALYEQTVGRLDRHGQDNDVDVFVILASVGVFPYDKEVKWKIIQYKRTLTDCVVEEMRNFDNTERTERATRAVEYFCIEFGCLDVFTPWSGLTNTITILY